MSFDIFKGILRGYKPEYGEHLVVIPEGVKEITGNAFCNCQSIESVVIPSSVRIIWYKAFFNCRMLKSVIFAENSQLVSVCGDVFSNCCSLKSIILPKTVTKVAPKTFSYCVSLESVSLLGVKSIDEKAFYGCKKLDSIEISDDIEFIDKDAFYKTRLKVNEKDGIGYIGNCNNLYLVSVVSKEDITEANIDKNCRLIYNYAFYGRENLKSVRIPANLVCIGKRAFSACLNLESVTFEENSNIKIIYEYAFCDCISLKSIVFPASLTKIEYYAFENCKKLKSITFEENSHLKTINCHAFLGCKSLTTLSLPNSVTTIGSCAFLECENLKSIKTPKLRDYYWIYFWDDDLPALKELNITSVPSDYIFSAEDFSYCSEIETVKLPPSVSGIKNGTFKKCKKLKRLLLPLHLKKPFLFLKIGCKKNVIEYYC